MSLRIAVDVRALFALAGQPVPETLPSTPVLEAMVREQFAFLPEPIDVTFDGWKGVLTYPDTAPNAEAEAARLAERAGRRAADGDYAKAISLWHRALKMQPANYLARRDLAMALVEQGETDEAKNQLIDALRIQPDELWSLVVLANLYMKHEKNLQTAERLLDHALEVKADDPWALNGLAVLRMKQGRTSEGLDIFERCIATAPSFANPYLGMAMALANADRTEEAKDTLERLFHHGEVPDARSLPVFAEARQLYGSLMADVAKRRQAKAAEVVEAMKRELAAVSGFEIRMRAGEISDGTAAKIQMAWAHKRDHHLILHRADYPEDLLLHLTAHEMGHLRLESAARAGGGA